MSDANIFFRSLSPQKPKYSMEEKRMGVYGEIVKVKGHLTFVVYKLETL